MYQDRTLTCADCGTQFVFTSSEQQFYSDRQFSDPRRCASCRASRKAARPMGGGGNGYGSSSYGSGSYGSREPRTREMFTVTCSSCGRDATVPFRPTSGKPVYCNDCFAARRA